jgi:ATP-dependent DNA helicase RecQ
MPLLSLLADQLRKLRTSCVPVAELRGGMGTAEKARLWAGMRDGTVRLVLATPEACLAERNFAELANCRLSHLVVDEAHCVSEWGDSFRPAYRAVGTLAARLGVAMVSAFTATASLQVLDRIREILFAGREVRVVAGSADRPEISYSVRPSLSRGRAVARLLREEQRPLLVFCRTRNGCETAARAVLRSAPDAPVRFYHAGLARDERADTEAWFLGSADGVLFATCAYGLGVDKPDIRTVAHLDVPASVEAYLQESGRAGRDGGPARAVLLLLPSEDAFLSQRRDPTERSRYLLMLGYARGAAGCMRAALLSLIGQEPPACSGCDVCDGTAASGPEGLQEMLWLVRRHARRFEPRDAAEILRGTVSARSLRSFNDCVPGFGLLVGWDREHVHEAIDALLAGGSLRIPRHGPWKGRLTTGRARA